MATYQTIREAVDLLALLYPRVPAIPENKLEILCLSWAETMEKVSDDVFNEAIKLHRQRSRYFPTEADILALAEEVMAARPAPLALSAESPLTVADFERNAAKAKAFLLRFKEHRVQQ